MVATIAQRTASQTGAAVGLKHHLGYFGSNLRLDGIDGDGGGTLQSIAVTPANPSVAKGLTQQFTATGTFSDGSTQNLTGSVTWASATTSTATITAGGPGDGSRGRGRRRSVQPSRGKTGCETVGLTVTAATLQSIAVTPANPSVAKGLERSNSLQPELSATTVRKT